MFVKPSRLHLTQWCTVNPLAALASHAFDPPPPTLPSPGPHPPPSPCRSPPPPWPPEWGWSEAGSSSLPCTRSRTGPAPSALQHHLTAGSHNTTHAV